MFISIYNDEGLKSHMWWIIKWLHNKLPHPVDTVYAYILGFLSKAVILITNTFKLRLMRTMETWFNYKKNRGMSIIHDMIDWIGGFPYEFAKFDVLVDYFEIRGFELAKGIEARNSACHQLVLQERKTQGDLMITTTNDICQ